MPDPNGKAQSVVEIPLGIGVTSESDSERTVFGSANFRAEPEGQSTFVREIPNLLRLRARTGTEREQYGASLAEQSLDQKRALPISK